MTKIKAEYIWADGTKPMVLLRSKTKIIKKGEAPGIWGFDGSSTNQATGDKSDCVLQPVRVCTDPIRKGDHLLVLCEVMTVNGEPHESNTRARLRKLAEEYAKYEMLYGIEQEYTFFRGQAPLGWPKDGFPAPQGPYYCSVGANFVFGRDIVEAHLEACLAANLSLCGINAEVMPGQWEFQVGPSGPLEVADQLIVARWLLCRISESFDCDASFDSKPAKGDWNGAGCHTNFSTTTMRDSYDACVAAAEALGAEGKPALHIANYGAGIEGRLTGLHETARYDEFSYGVSDRGASVRIPWQVERDGKGYVEDRRPNANCDPYTVNRLIIETVCGAAS